MIPCALNTLAAIARSWLDPRLGSEAGDMLTVTRVCGHATPAAVQPDLTRSRASLSEASGSPMIEK